MAGKLPHTGKRLTVSDLYITRGSPLPFLLLKKVFWYIIAFLAHYLE